MKSSLKYHPLRIPLLTLAIVVSILIIGMIIFLPPVKATTNEGRQIILSTGDERHEVNFSGVKWGMVIELKSFGDKFSQDILVARVRVKNDLSDKGIERVAYVAESEGVHVGERVIVHSISQRDNHGFNYTMIVTKDRNTNAPSLW